MISRIKMPKVVCKKGNVKCEDARHVQNCKCLLNISSVDIVWFILETSELFFSLTFNKFFINLFLVENKITSIKVGGKNVDFSTIKYTSKRVRGKNVDSSTINIISKKGCGNNVDFSTIEIAWKKYLETTWIFWSAKLHWKSTRKWRGNSSKFGLPLIDVISTSNWHEFYVVCPLGIVFNNHQIALGERN